MANQSLAYDLERFSAAPKRTSEVQPPKPRLVKPAPKTTSEIKAEKKYNLKKVIKFLVIAAVCFGFVGSNISYRIQINELNSTIVRYNRELNEKKSENTRLNMELDSKISLANVQDYAENTLGMIKRERYQIVYFDLENSNEIIPAS